MTAAFEVRYDPTALVALEEAADYIEEQSGNARASAWLEAMRSSIEKLETQPRAFAVVVTRGSRPIHSKLVMSHRVFYIVDDPTATVYIIDVVHTARETRLLRYRER